MRLVARLGLLIAGGVLCGVALRGFNAAMNQAADPGWSFTSAGTGFVIVMLATIFGRSAWNLGRNYVVHFEVWPKSHLAVVRTAGWWKETTILIPWNDIRTGNLAAPTSQAGTDSLMRVRLRSGAKLIFDHHAGNAPQSWAALNRFLEKCSLPGTTETEDQYPFGQSVPNLPPVASAPFGS